MVENLCSCVMASRRPERSAPERQAKEREVEGGGEAISYPAWETASAGFGCVQPASR